MRALGIDVGGTFTDAVLVSNGEVRIAKETSSRITDVVFDAFSKAIPVPAQGQGTMNNIVRVERYELRPGSGGAGRRRGGDGVVRELRVLERCRLSLLTQRRALRPRGAQRGEDGLPGRSYLNGVELPAISVLDLEPGDLLRVETPAGGGSGEPQSR